MRIALRGSIVQLRVVCDTSSYTNLLAFQTVAATQQFSYNCESIAVENLKLL